MRIINMNQRWLAIVVALGLSSGPARSALAGTAGARGHPEAVDANSVDAIKAELERAEHLVCAGCTDLVVPLVDHSTAASARPRPGGSRAAG